MGLRPGVRREDFWGWAPGEAYFVPCSVHREVRSIDPRFSACEICGHTWRRDTLKPPDWREDPIDATIPMRRCITCRAQAQRKGRTDAEELPFHQLNVCHGCGAFVCYPHTYWHGEEWSETLCRSCRMARAKDDSLSRGECKYGEGCD